MKKIYLIFFSSIFFQCPIINNNIFKKIETKSNIHSERIPIILYFGDSSKLSINKQNFYQDYWTDTDLQIYRVDNKIQYFTPLHLEEGDILEELTYYNSKYYKTDFKAFIFPIFGTIETTDDKIIATGYLRKKLK
ncbi:hypothetical protein EHQ16_19375 [Leptospira kanakyensis]|uniref:Uncharacterized protein n=1 Tax=Leptospira kanakyensis TaxID=2484968 RepID=A0A6N4Q584_9LEPT|nr:hypothetical protein [Leptospira kanakyensis]TGK51145.1 hypothetical protein EHQ11_09105 [Leptospira kanakyensis]TGK56371.1 hypothetical protein EHQ16_19375 [Leptospira kanakyensis]TGK65689.1 hypothetical protein EHQ18_19160 [Leptospira kanakyensis]